MLTARNGTRIMRRLAISALIAAGLVAAGPAAAAFRPLPVIDLVTDDRVEDVAAEASRQGDAVVGWTGNDSPATVLAAFRPGDGPFAPVEFLTTKPNGENPDFVFEPDGAVLAVWSHATVGETGGWTTRSRTGTFAAPALSLPSEERFSEIGIDGAGTALAVWKSEVMMGMDVVVASRRAAGGVFEPPVQLSSPFDDNGAEPRVAVNPGGEAAVAWTRDAPSDGTRLEARIGSVSGPSFQPLQLLASGSSADESLSPPEVAIGTSGEAIAVWSRSTPNSTSLEYAVRPPGAIAFGSPQPLAADAFGASIGIDPASGTAVIAFTRGPQGSLVPSAVVRSPGGALSPISPLAPPSAQTDIASVGFDASGAALVAWTRFLSSDNRLAEASRRPPGGAFEPAALIANMATGHRLAVAAEPDGDAVAAWRFVTSSTEQVLRVGGLDFTPDPLVAAPGAPAAAVARLCGGKKATIVGTPRADRIRGTARRDVIAALGGDDVVRGLGGADLICGGAGRDTLRGGAGRDRLLGGAGRDRLFGGLGRDALIGGPGRDRQVR